MAPFYYKIQLQRGEYMDYDKLIKSLTTDYQYATMINEYGVTSLNELDIKHIDIILNELHRQIDGHK